MATELIKGKTVEEARHFSNLEVVAPRWGDCRRRKFNAPSWPAKPCGPRWRIMRSGIRGRARPGGDKLSSLCARFI